jgi:hypothetical protein
MSTEKINELLIILKEQIVPLEGISNVKIKVGRESYLLFSIKSNNIHVKADFTIGRDVESIYPTFLFYYKDLRPYFDKKQAIIYLHPTRQETFFEAFTPLSEEICLTEDSDVNIIAQRVMDEYIGKFFKYYFPFFSDLSKIEADLNKKIHSENFKYKSYCLYTVWHAIVGTLLAKHLLPTDNYEKVRDFYYSNTFKEINDTHDKKILFKELFLS